MPLTIDNSSLQGRLIERVWREAGFRERLREDAAAILRDEFGVVVHAHQTIRIIERTADEVVFVIPSPPEDRSDRTLPAPDATPFAGTNISGKTGCHSCC